MADGSEFRGHDLCEGQEIVMRWRLIRTRLCYAVAKDIGFVATAQRVILTARSKIPKKRQAIGNCAEK